MKTNLFKSIYDTPAYNYVFFIMYYSMYQNSLVSDCENEAVLLQNIAGLSRGKDFRDKAKALIINATASIENIYNSKLIPFHYKAFDCLINENDIDILSVDSSYSFTHFVGSFECKETIRAYYASFTEALDTIFAKEPHYRADILDKKQSFKRQCEDIANIPILDNAYEMFAEIQEKESDIFANDFKPFEILGYGTIADYRDKYLSSISAFIQQLDFDSFNDLKKISVCDYYTRINLRIRETIRNAK